MDISQLLVTLGGLGLLAFVAWFFFWAPHRVGAATLTTDGVQQVDIQVKGGYSPDVIELRRGQPVQLRFHRAEDSSCSEELLIPDFQVRRTLPAYQTTTVELRPQHAGQFEFTCGMHMLRGSLLVK
ncbi:cupredoxin domain-containing protein [Hymenobacter sp. RP-2-7]|uniref:Cupredoxin domain-containing protein n=1 Tax=Hymenobacter polaris TaxID=2682546 RepID=A0A7Y0ABA3_9BACT|nr:cupredoxin domain-containing protein [Hymenobacter polaris]NML64162.1 cupredoxin domain-containing protein [Hymenobacter polaris]